MTNYVFKVTTTTIERFSIEADSEEEARAIFDNDEINVDPFDWDTSSVVVLEEDD